MAKDIGMSDSAQVRIVIADDHPVVRDGLAAILSTQADFAVIGVSVGVALIILLGGLIFFNRMERSFGDEI